MAEKHTIKAPSKRKYYRDRLSAAAATAAGVTAATAD